jgi:N12 class adenine-specific DNA methylase
MTVVQRRLTKLEECFSCVTLPDPGREAQIEALVRLHPDELQLMEMMALRHDPAIPESETEHLVMARYKEVLLAVANERGLAA